MASDLLSEVMRHAASIIKPPEVPDPLEFYRSTGLEPDEWQRRLLQTTARRVILNCSRQSGKSTTVGVIVMHHAIFHPKSLIVIGSPSLRQSTELLQKAMDAYRLGALTWDIQDTEQDARTMVTLKNGSRIVAVPGKSGGTVRSFSAVSLLVIDEASFASDEFFKAVMPMLAVSHGRIIVLSTPHGKRNRFYELFTKTADWDFARTPTDQEAAWEKFRVTWRDCPRITPEFIASERMLYGDAYVRQEYETEFLDEAVSIFTTEETEAMARQQIEQFEDLW